MTEHFEETEERSAGPYEPPALVAGQFAEVTRGPSVGCLLDGFGIFLPS